MKQLLIKSTALAALVMLGSAAHAQAGSNTIYFGVANVNVSSVAPPLSGPFTPPNAGLSVGDKSTVSMGYIRGLTDNIEVEFALGIPPTHDVKGTGALAAAGIITRAKNTAPTVFVNYRFLAPSAQFRPFVGIGVNYTQFSASSTASGDAASGGPTKVELSPSTGLALQAGVSFKLNSNWAINAAYVMADVKTDLKATTNGVIIRKTTVDLRPKVLTANISYTF